MFKKRGKSGSLSEHMVDETQVLSTSIHPFSTAYPIRGHGAGGLSLGPISAKVGSPWTSLQPITGLTYKDKQSSTHIVTPMTNYPNPQFACFWTVGGSWSTRREPKQTQREHANTIQKCLDPELNPGPSCCEAMTLTTVLQSNTEKEHLSIKIACAKSPLERSDSLTEYSVDPTL